MNQAEKACELFELGSYGKSFVYALALFHSGEARKAFDHMARFPQDHRTPVLSGMLHLFQDDFDSAASHFETAIKILPSVEAYFLLVLTRLYMQQPQKSLELIEQSQDLVPGECQSYLRACVLRSKGELEASLNELETVKSFSMIHYQKAVSLRCMEKYEEALKQLALEEEHFPKWINKVQKSLVYAACGNESGLKQSCSELAPHHWVLLGNKRIYASSKEFENALQRLAQLEQSDWGTLTRDEYLTLAKVHNYAHFTELTVSNFF